MTAKSIYQKLGEKMDAMSDLKFIGCKFVKNLVSRMNNIDRKHRLCTIDAILSIAYLHLIGPKNVHSDDNSLPFFLCTHFPPLSYRFFADTMRNTTSITKNKRSIHWLTHENKRYH